LVIDEWRPEDRGGWSVWFDFSPAIMPGVYVLVVVPSWFTSAAHQLYALILHMLPSKARA
jgi:hypothetical protein